MQLEHDTRYPRQTYIIPQLHHRKGVNKYINIAVQADDSAYRAGIQAAPAKTSFRL